MSTSIGTDVNTMKWLIKREFWEHKGGFFWAPVVVAIVMAVFLAVAIAGTAYVGSQGVVTYNVESIDGGVAQPKTVKVLTPEKIKEVGEQLSVQIAHAYMGISAPLLAVFYLAVVFFCLGALYDERKNRSILFWKSLPISDAATVVSKVVTAIVLAPVLTFCVATILALVVVVVACTTSMLMGFNMFSEVLGAASFYFAPLQIAALLPVYVLWALPSVGLLLMIGALAPSKPFLWAVGTPLVTGVFLAMTNSIFQFGWNLSWYWRDIVGRGFLSVMPGSWFAMNPLDSHFSPTANVVDMAPLFSQSWQQLATANLWIGVVVGSAMIYAAIRVRRWKDEG